MERKLNRRIVLLLGTFALVGILVGIVGILFLKGKLLRGRPPVVIEVVAQYPGASAEEVERQVTIPLEVACAGVPGLRVVRSKSLFGLASVQLEFDGRVGHDEARQGIIGRLSFVDLAPPGVTPSISPGPGRPIVAYTLVGPRDPMGRSIYTLNDLRALQDWVLEREFRRVPRIVGVSSFGGTLRSYEVQPDPDRLRRYGIALSQLQTALNNGNAPAEGNVSPAVWRVGMIGGGADPVTKALGLDDPQEAARFLRAEDELRIRDLRQRVITTINGNPVRVEDVVDGGRVAPRDLTGVRGVIVGHYPRVGRAGITRWLHGPVQDDDGNPLWGDDNDCVQGRIYLRPGDDAPAAQRDIQAKFEELNTPGRMLPGVRLEPYLDETSPSDSFWIHALLPVNTNLDEAAALVDKARACVRQYGETDRVISEIGGPDDGTTPAGIDAVRLFVGLRSAKEWPGVGTGNRARTKTELMDAISEELESTMPGVGWECSLHAREGLQGEFVGTADEPVLKLIGPDLDELERLAAQAKEHVQGITGVRSVRLPTLKGKARLEFHIDQAKCAKWGVSVADVQNSLQAALAGSRSTAMIDGERIFDVTVRWPGRLVQDESILDMPVDVTNLRPVVAPEVAPAPVVAPVVQLPRLRLRDLVTAVDSEGRPNPDGVATIYREQGNRLLMLRLSVRGRNVAAVRADTEKAILPLLPADAGYRLEWDTGH